MKFDKFMEHCYKIMCIVVVCVVAFGSVVSCFNKPFKVSASGPSFDIAQDFWRIYNNNLKRVQEAITHDIANGNFDATTSLGKQYLRMFTYQMLFKNYDPDGAMFINDWENDSISISFSGLSAVYRNYNDNNVYPVTINFLSGGFIDTSFIFATAKDFTVECNGYQNGIRFTSYVNKNYTSNAWEVTFGMYRPTNYNNPWATYSYTGNLANYSSNLSSSVSIKASSFLIEKNSIPTIRNLTDGQYIGGLGQVVDLPDGELDNYEPWDYYNDVLMPFIMQDCPNYDIDLFVFPNGYAPPLLPDPTEPGTLPAGGISIGSNNNIDIDINVYYPTDESGQPVTDESGETVTETYYVTDTTPTDVVYKFTIPTLPNLDRYSDTLPPMNLAQFESGINFIFSAADGIFTDTGFLPVIIVTLSLCALCYVIWKIGG